MGGYDVKEVMDQIHISPEMQEEIIMNIQKRMKNGNKNTTDTAVQYEISEESQEILEVRAAAEAVQTQADAQAQSAETGSIRTYSDKEIERMAELQQSYLEGSASPEKQILEVENAESVVMDTLCYIKDTGDYCLPDRELADEELLEIIEYNYKKKVALNGKTQEQMDAEDLVKDLTERAMLEEKVRAAGGISEEEPEDFFAYSCYVNAVNGSICCAYSISGDDRYLDEDDIVWYEH